MATKIPTATSPITSKNIEKATNFLSNADGSTNKTQIKSAIAFLNNALKKKIGPDGPQGKLAPLVPIIHRSIADGQKALAATALNTLAAGTKVPAFKGVAMPTAVDAGTKQPVVNGRVEFQIKRRDGQNLLYTKPAPMPMRTTRGLGSGTQITTNKAGGKNLRFDNGRDIVGARWDTASLDSILAKTDPRRKKLEAAGFDLQQTRNMLVLAGEGDKHPTIVLEGAGYPTSQNGAIPGRMYLQQQTGVTVLCTDLQFVPFKASDPSGGGTMVLRKPVVYLYPQSVQDVKVEVRVDGEFISQYPKALSSTSNSALWQVKAGPSGEIFDPKTERRFSYLFWEAARKTSFTIDPAQAFCIKSAAAEGFLEDVAKSYALNDRERTDFVSYWLPALEKNPYSLVQVLTDAEYDRYAEMTITPKPDTTLRLFMVFQSVHSPLKVGAPKLSQRDRKGFVVVEWGGANLDER